MHYPGQLGLAIFALICSCHFLWLYASFSQAILFQIFIFALFPQFTWWNLPFPSYFIFHNLIYLGDDVSTDGMTLPPHTALNYHIFDLHSNTHPDLKNNSWHPIDQSLPTQPNHTMLHPMQLRLIHNITFTHFTTVQQKDTTSKHHFSSQVITVYTIRPFPSTAFFHFPYLPITSTNDSPHKTKLSINEPFLTSSLRTSVTVIWGKNRTVQKKG